MLSVGKNPRLLMCFYAHPQQYYASLNNFEFDINYLITNLCFPITFFYYTNSFLTQTIIILKLLLYISILSGETNMRILLAK